MEKHTKNSSYTIEKTPLIEHITKLLETYYQNFYTTTILENYTLTSVGNQHTIDLYKIFCIHNNHHAQICYFTSYKGSGKASSESTALEIARKQTKDNLICFKEFKDAMQVTFIEIPLLKLFLDKLEKIYTIENKTKITRKDITKVYESLLEIEREPLITAIINLIFYNTNGLFKAKNYVSHENITYKKNKKTTQIQATNIFAITDASDVLISIFYSIKGYSKTYYINNPNTPSAKEIQAKAEEESNQRNLDKLIPFNKFKEELLLAIDCIPILEQFLVELEKMYTFKATTSITDTTLTHEEITSTYISIINKTKPYTHTLEQTKKQ